MPGFSYLTKSQPRSDDALPVTQSVALAAPLAASSTASIRDVASAAASVRSGASASAEALAAIQARTATLAAHAQDAKRDALLVADATVELAQSSNEIDKQVRAAGALTDDAGDAALAANRSVDELKASSAEIGKVVN